MNSATPRDPIEHLRHLEQLAGGMDSGEDNRMSHLAVLYAIKGMTDALERIADRQDRHDDKLGEVVATLHNIDKRVAAVESDSLTSRVDKLEIKLESEMDKRVNALEVANYRRQGSMYTIGAIVSSNVFAWIIAAVGIAAAIVIHYKP